MSLYPFLLANPFAAIHKHFLGVASLVTHSIQKWVRTAPKYHNALPIQLPVMLLWGNGDTSNAELSKITLSTQAGGQSEVICDYGKCVGGRPVFSVSGAFSEGNEFIEIDVVYSESREGANFDQGKLLFHWGRKANGTELTVF